MQPANDGLLFLKKKIEEIKIALFKAETDSILRLPNNIISTIKVDDGGYIWFFTSCTGPYAQYLDAELFVSLDYYSKETQARILINGKAFIEKETPQAALEQTTATPVGSKMILLKVKILKAEYFDNRTFSKITMKEKIKSAFNYIIAATPHRMYDFSS